MNAVHDTTAVGASVSVEIVTIWLEQLSGEIALGANPMKVQALLHKRIVALGEIREAHEEGRA